MEMNRRDLLVGLGVTAPLVPEAAKAAVPPPAYGVVATADGPWVSRIIHLDADRVVGAAKAIVKPPGLRRTFIDLPCEAYVQSIG